MVVTRTWAKLVDGFVEFSISMSPEFLMLFFPQQDLSLNAERCMTLGTIQHELIHALGYDHMHNHIDRDNFIEIKLENVRDEKSFVKVDALATSNFGTTYDLLSVMHYNSKAFSKNGMHTIIPKDSKYLRKMGQRLRMSQGDVQRLNNMYQCTRLN